MAEKEKDQEASEKPGKELRDLQPKKEVKGGVRNPRPPAKRPARKTAEIDFMNWD